jgi:CelD/BcsL family acetyltransferase involved in cellulose biosynthesis
MQKGWFSVWTLRLNGRLLATEYQLIHDGNVHALRADFDIDCLDMSPGSHLGHQLLERLFGNGLRRYCMGPGENAYKLRWSSEGDRLSQLLVYGRTLRGRCAWLRDAVVKRRLKRLFKALSSVQRPTEPPKLEQPD